MISPLIMGYIQGIHVITYWTWLTYREFRSVGMYILKLVENTIWENSEKILKQKISINYYFRILINNFIDAHSGYNIPFHPLRLIWPIYGGAHFHDFHHSIQGRNGNFGGYRFWDWLMSTDAVYKKAIKLEKSNWFK